MQSICDSTGCSQGNCREMYDKRLVSELKVWLKSSLKFVEIEVLLNEMNAPSWVDILQ